MQLLSHFIASVAAAEVSIDGLTELRVIVDACPFREHREIPSITLEQLISWRQVSLGMRYNVALQGTGGEAAGSQFAHERHRRAVRGRAAAIHLVGEEKATDAQGTRTALGHSLQEGCASALRRGVCDRQW